MKITLEPTNELIAIGNSPARLWKGTADDGSPVVAVIFAVGVEPGSKIEKEADALLWPSVVVDIVEPIGAWCFRQSVAEANAAALQREHDAQSTQEGLVLSSYASDPENGVLSDEERYATDARDEAGSNDGAEY
jgi:hypothetical protein